VTSLPVSDASIHHQDQENTLKPAAAHAKASKAAAPAAADGSENAPTEGVTAARSGDAAMPGKRAAAKKRQSAKAAAAVGRVTRRRAG
jgi:phage I-like protein